MSRTTAWRRVKEVMDAADIAGTPRIAQRLRHSFGVNAILSGVPLSLLRSG